METIIGLLFILLPVIFKLIGKRFEQSGQQDKARKVRELAQALDGEDSPMHDWEYFGLLLLDKGIITETQHRRMKAQINVRKRPVSERSER